MSAARLLPWFYTALGPMLWGTTYIVFTETLPVEYPLYSACARAVIAGLILTAIAGRLPGRHQFIPALTLGMTNIGIFFALLFYSAARLPGGITATVAACQPFLIALVAWPLLARRPRLAELALALLGIGGVALLVGGDPAGLLDLVGVLAAAGAALSMAVGVVLTERWRAVAPPLQMIAWQLLLAGLVLLPVAALVEGSPPVIDARGAAGLGWLVAMSTALGYWFWLSGVQKLGASVGVLSFLSPVVATLLGALLLEEWPSPLQLAGIAIIFTAIAFSVALANSRSSGKK